MSPATLVYGLCVLGVGALWSTFSGLSRFWQSVYDYRHGYLIAAVSLVWLLLLRKRIDASAVRPRAAALPLLAGAIGVWVIAYHGNSEIVQQLLAPVIILLAVYAALGREVARRVAAPLGYLYFSIPIWDQLVPLLQLVTTAVAESALWLLQVPATVESHTVTIPEGTFAIVEGCSGKRYLLVGLAFAVLLAATQGLRGKRAALLIAFTAALALVVNWVRVIVIIYAGHVSNMEHYLVAQDHITFGWIMFVPLLLAVIWIARRLSKGASHAEPERPHAPAMESIRGAHWLLPAACLCVPILVVMTGNDTTFGRPRLAPLPIMAGEWQGPMPADALWRPRFEAPADERLAAYTSPQGAVQVYVNVYGRQARGHELIFFSNSVAPSGHWTIVDSQRRGDSMMLLVVADAASHRWAIAQTYAIDGRHTAVPAFAQLYYGLKAAWRPVPAGTIALAAACQADCTGAVELIDSFWRNHGSAIAGLIPKEL
ncbi:MAG TPA: exosortase [Steroidobacteraceae bacterium]|nr:exosortase [Steroidobacteraceae bacterium]